MVITYFVIRLVAVVVAVAADAAVVVAVAIVAVVVVVAVSSSTLAAAALAGTVGHVEALLLPLLETYCIDAGRVVFRFERSGVSCGF